MNHAAFIHDDPSGVSQIAAVEQLTDGLKNTLSSSAVGGAAAFTAQAAGTPRPESGSYIANLAAANTLFMTRLQDRVGESHFINALKGQPEVTSLWVRQSGGHNFWRDSSRQLKTQSNRYATLVGGDLARWYGDDGDRWHVGFMAGYGSDRSKTSGESSAYHAKGKVKGYSVGTYASWFANGEIDPGAWVDSWVQYGWFDNEVRSKNAPEEHYKSHGITASLEAGYGWKLGQFNGSRGTLNEWFIQPQIQVVWMGVRADRHQDPQGYAVREKGDGNVATRLGFKTWLNSHHAMDSGKEREFQPWLSLNWLHNTRSFSVSQEAPDERRVSQRGAKDLAEVSLGLDAKINPRLNLWGNVGARVGSASYSDISGIVGVQYHF